MKSLFLLGFFLLSPLAQAEDLVAVLDLKFVKETKRPAEWKCFGDNNDDCYIWAHFYVYEARVKKIVSGTAKSKKFKVLYGKHNLNKRNKKNVIAKLSKIGGKKGGDYQVLEWGKKKEMYCFNGAGSNHNVHMKSSQKKLKCYD